MALNLIVYSEGLGWALKRGDDGPVIAWFRAKNDALTAGRAMAEAEDRLLVVLDHPRNEATP